MATIRILAYRQSNGVEPFTEWLVGLKDKTTRLRILTRLDRLERGNLGDHKFFGSIGELRIRIGPGHRIYFGREGDSIVILLAGGDKGSQSKDVAIAIRRWQEHRRGKRP